jgi:hypothetical protein
VPIELISRKKPCSNKQRKEEPNNRNFKKKTFKTNNSKYKRSMISGKFKTLMPKIKVTSKTKLFPPKKVPMTLQIIMFFHMFIPLKFISPML